MSITNRDYQQRVKNETYVAWNSGKQNVVIVMPTGSGKSVVVSDVINDGVQVGMMQSVIAHRNELVSQMSGHIARRGIPHRIVGSDSTIAQITREHRKEFGRSFVNPSARTAVVGIDTLMSRASELAPWAAQHDRWIGDEFHHFLKENKWGKGIALYKNAHGLGVTATPSRADGKGLGREFEGIADHMILGPTMRELINAQYLCDYEIVCPRSDLQVDDSEVSANGDWSNSTLRKAAKKSHIVGDVVENYGKYAYGRRAICFATDVETAGEIAAKFNDFGIRAAALSAKTPLAVREKFINEFKTGKLLVLVNVDLFDEGFDVPACDVVIMARPTASLGKYLQMIGRALRYMPGKVALIIDQVSNVVRHGLPDKHRDWTLARRDKRGKQVKDPDDIPLIACLRCTKPYERFRVCCPYCGAEKPLPIPRERSLAMVEGDLILLDRETLERMRQQTIIESAADVAQKVAAAAGQMAGKGAANRQIEKIAQHQRLENVIAQWAACQRQAGFNDREIQKKFFHTTGMDILTALDGSRSRVDLEETANQVEGWYK